MTSEPGCRRRRTAAQLEKQIAEMDQQTSFELPLLIVVGQGEESKL